ncbi:lysine--tRNA ligase [Wolbachia pipientis]|uniref:Lysine--tRNA ligase n=1 Tax=Wolbachia pipientis TaxID=955 RepID=A0A6H2NT45_WOLPI|nr:lysine--tRNA ligase [Wolbachia endosymbiont of Aedes albopictus]TVS86209.1 lysine--tRNA ligase [Wolbachia pipientis]TVS95177.1 lysine--tRNA ligase [Wolbachia pipientis]UVW83413.1 lysine--tRNA ligase [Wolbachia endosymbiont of Aedes albopictus]
MISWPFQEAEKILQEFPNKKEIIFETGYGPSGLPHIGTFGEVFRTTVVVNALKKIAPGIKTKIIAVSDDMDGLRKIPDNVPNQEMLREHLNKPLTMIPDPFGTHESYGHHMNLLLCKFLDLFEFEYEFRSATECYKSGVYDEKLLLLLKNYDKVMDVMLPSFREERQQTYSPFLPICPKTSQVLQVPVIETNTDKGTITYEDPNGEKIEVSVTKGKCKLQWKPDWGMRWAAFGVNYEAHGKDLTPSAVLSSQICEILGEKPPLLFCYELFLDKEGKKISKSRGNGISIEEWLTYAPTESLALYIFQSPKKAKRLYFDVIPKSTDEYLEFVKHYNENNGENTNSKFHTEPGYDEKFLGEAQVSTAEYSNVFEERKQALTTKLPSEANPAWHIHQGNVPNIETSGINFSLLLNLAAACNAENKEIIWGFISSYAPSVTPENNKMLDRLSDFAVKYYHDFIKPTKSYKTPNAKEREALLDLKDTLHSLSTTVTAEEIQSQVFSIGKKYDYTNLRDWFQLLYEMLLGQKTGPRMGSFIKLYGIDNTISLIESATKCIL